MKINGISVLLIAASDFRDSADQKSAERWVSWLGLQRQLPVELLIIEDKDASAFESIFHKYSDPRIQSIRVPDSAGYGFAMNAGVNLSRYDWVLVADRYQAWSAMDAAISLFGQDPDLTISGFGMPAEISSQQLDVISWENLRALFEKGTNPFDGCAVLFRKDIFRLIGGCPMDVAFSGYQDIALWKIWLRFFKGVKWQPQEAKVLKTDTLRKLPDLKLLSGFPNSPLSSMNCLKNHEQCSALNHIARVLGVSLIDAGRICYLAWNAYDYILDTNGLFVLLTILFPDCPVISGTDMANHLADRFLLFSWENDRTRLSGIHDLNELMGIIRNLGPMQ